MAKKTKSQSVSDCVTDAFALIEEIKDETQETFDNMSDTAQGGERGEFLSELINSLEAHSEPEPEDFVASEDVEIKDAKPTSKKAKRDHAVYLIENVCSVIELLEADDSREWSDDEREHLVSLRDELETVKSDWESIEFSR